MLKSSQGASGGLWGASRLQECTKVVASIAVFQIFGENMQMFGAVLGPAGSRGDPKIVNFGIESIKSAKKGGPGGDPGKT